MSSWNSQVFVITRCFLLQKAYQQSWWHVFFTGIKGVSFWCKLQMQEPLKQYALPLSPYFCKMHALITHLSSFLLITSKELANLIHETRSLLLASQPWGACSSHSGCRSSEPGSFSVQPCLRSEDTPVSFSIVFGAYEADGLAFEGVVQSVPGNH